ncbi:MAG: transposase [Firmicutes bacterium]|jgi:REP element-mobilizing transposase RayT|nr:transposase [Bacillota bacterium]
MPRTARKVSSTGIYHVIARGINRQKIFLDDNDCHRYLIALEQIIREEGSVLLGYCLMVTHLHLLINACSVEILSRMMKRLGISYASWFNWKYERNGHLFQGRFRSECVEDDSYLLTAIRYIHKNPVKAGLVRRAEQYRWSSCRTYYGGKDYLPGLIDTELVLSLFDKKRSDAIERFRKFMKEDSDDLCLKGYPTKRLKDNEVREELIKLLGNRSIGELQKLNRVEMNSILNRAKQIKGCSLRQLVRITGIGYNIVYRA